MCEMECLLHERKSFEVTTLYQRLLKKEHNLQQQPFYAPLAGLSIVLRKLEGDHVLGSGSQTYVIPSICIDISLFEQPSETQRERILHWLTVSSPKEVSAIEVLDVFRKAGSAVHLGQKFIQELSNDTSTAATIISNPAKACLFQHFETLLKAVDKPVPACGPNEAFVVGIVKDLKEKSQDFLESIEDCVASATIQQLQYLAAYEETRMSSLASRISMRLTLLKDSSVEDESYEEEKIRFETPSKDKERLRKGELGDLSVLVEYYYPDPTPGQSMDFKKASAKTELIQARKVAALHAEPKEDAFCTLAGKGIVQEHLHQFRLGFIYVLPLRYRTSPFTFLTACFRDYPNVPLEVRLKLAQKLTAAVINLHSIGWLHKKIQSENVLVFSDCRADESEMSRQEFSVSLPNFEDPFLLGFNCSRLAVAGSSLRPNWNIRDNLYLHPNRWARPLTFSKLYDIYALVSAPIFPLING